MLKNILLSEMPVGILYPSAMTRSFGEVGTGERVSLTGWGDFWNNI